MWQTFLIDVIKKVAVGESSDSANLVTNASETKVFLKATQGEVGTQFRAILLCNGEPYYISDGVQFSIWYEGASGKGNYSQIDGRTPVTISGNALQIELIPQMTSVAGGGVLAVMLHGSDGSIRKLFHLTYIVDEFPGYGSEEAKAYFTAFSEAVADVKDSVLKVTEVAATFETDKSLSIEGKAADAAAVSRSSTPYNYLDNSDFRNPVNQRGQTSYTSVGYCIDRWAFSTAPAACTVAKGSGVTITAGSADVYLNQRFDPKEHIGTIAGKAITFAAMTDKGLLLKSMVLPTIKGELSRTPVENGVQMTIGYYSSGQYYWVDIVVSGGTSLTLYWAALYEGEYTDETLPEYKPKGYGGELGECLRYYQACDDRITIAGCFDGNGCLDLCYPLSVEMRTNPTIICNANGDNTIELYVNGEYTTVSVSYQYRSTKYISPRCINGGWANKPCFAAIKFVASADL